MDDNILKNQHIKQLLDIGIALTAEKDYDKLLEKILTGARSIANADGGTLYLVEQNQLHYKIMQTTSLDIFMGGNGEKINFPPLEMLRSNVSAYSAITKQSINIPDVYHSALFDFSGPKKFDAATGYVTTSMLVIPLINREDKVIGVLQLINALDDRGLPIPFAPHIENIVKSLASQAGIALENMQYVDEIKQFFKSFVEVLATAIDERTPYNANHSKTIAQLIGKFAAYLNTVTTGRYREVSFDESQIHEIVTTAWLHDIGKIAIPLEILDKPTRLGDTEQPLLLRLDLIAAKLRLQYLEKAVATTDADVRTQLEQHWQETQAYMADVRQFVLEVNRPTTFMDAEKLEKLAAIKQKKWDGIEEELLTDADFENLSIVKGTLTTQERTVIEHHVSATERILSKMTFPEYLKHVPDWAAKHHEFLDGSGYCKGCGADDLPIEVRMLTILDIYDALTAIDRPYKPGMPKEKAIQILGFMVKEGKLDKELVACFIESRIWE